MIVVTVVSLRVGQVTFCASARTSCRNLNGLTFAIALASSVPAQSEGRDRPPVPFRGLGSSRKSVTGPLTMPLPTAGPPGRQGKRDYAWPVKQLRPVVQFGNRRVQEASRAGYEAAQLGIEDLALAGVEGLPFLRVVNDLRCQLRQNCCD
jgi:hypothetical protein